MITVYRGCDGDDAPFEMQCEEFGFPNRTTCGEIMYSNTHFLTREEAINSIRESAEAGIRFAAGRIEHVQKQLRDCEQDAVRAALRMARVLAAIAALESQAGEEGQNG
jgi:hypothetical protein